MFKSVACAASGCTRYALENSLWCLLHSPDSEKQLALLLQSLQEAPRHRDLIINDASVRQLNLSKSHLSTCDFSRCLFEDVDFSQARLHACFF
ncbi:MAG: pentapeptide repeat-containing protein [Sphaerochaetaceae bacterium]